MNTELTNSLRILTRAHFDYQMERLRIDGMLGIKKNGEIKKKTPPRDEAFLSELYKRRDEVFAIEELLLKELSKEVHKHPLWKTFLDGVKGVGPAIAAVIITEIDIQKAVTVSNLWSFAGMAPGKDKRVRGQKCTYNQYLKRTLLGILGPSFLKSYSPYADFYRNMRVRLESMDYGIASKNPSDKDHPKAFHQHNYANRYMVKMFLKDL